MKLGIVVGHTAKAPGAHSSFLQVHEYHWNSDLADRIVKNKPASLEVKVFFRDGIGIAGAYKESDAWGSDMTVELHFNSADSPHATGTGILYHPNSTKGRTLATLLRQEIGTALDLPDWPSGTGGVVTPFEASGEERRGQKSLSAGIAPATLIEPFFGSNSEDCARAKEGKDELAKAILDAAARF